MKHTPATPLPDERAFRNILRGGYVNTAAAAYVDALNQRARLVEALRFASAVLSDSGLTSKYKSVFQKKCDAINDCRALLAELGE